MSDLKQWIDNRGVKGEEYLGDLCRNNHEYLDTGKSIRCKRTVRKGSVYGRIQKNGKCICCRKLMADKNYLNHKEEKKLYQKQNEEHIKEYRKEKYRLTMLDPVLKQKRNDSYPQFSDHYFTGEYPIEALDKLGNEKITFCDHANFTDLCKGGHIPSTKFIKSVKLLNTAGAYWRGDENNEMLTRIYGTAWRTEKELKTYLNSFIRAATDLPSTCLLYTSPSPRDVEESRMPSSA